MKVLLDGLDIFDQDGIVIEYGEFEREHLRRAIPGLDGSIGIDLGSRGRAIRQRGKLRASNHNALNDRINAIEKFKDGSEHTLTNIFGELFEHVIIERFEIVKNTTSGTGITAEYSITYRQMV